MDFLTQLLQPEGMWQGFIFGLETVVKDYGLALILITVIIKLILIPMDFLNRYITINSSRKQAKLKPQVDKLKKVYAANPQMLQQKTMELYKRENFGVMGTCLGTLLNLVITSVVFFTLLGALNSISLYKQSQEFVNLETRYYEIILEDLGYDVPSLTNEQFIELKTNLTDEQISAGNELASQAVVEYYEEIRADFLWIKNIWKADTSTNAILTYNEFSNIAKSFVEENNITIEEYDRIMSPVDEVYGGSNGWYLLVILAAGTTFLSIKISSWITNARNKKRNKEIVDPVASNKIVVIILPLFMAIFTLFYNSAFGIYIVTSSLFSLITSPLVTLAAGKLDEIKEKKEKEKITVSYSRKN